MGWSIGYDPDWKRDIGYSVKAYCDHPKCSNEIHRGLAYVCGGQPYGGDKGCGLYFCYDHLVYHDLVDGETAQVCPRCDTHKRTYKPKPDHRDWVYWKLTHESWAEWRLMHPKEATALREAIWRETH